MFDDHLDLYYSAWLEDFKTNAPIEYALYVEFTSKIDITNYKEGIIDSIEGATNLEFIDKASATAHIRAMQEVGSQWKGIYKIPFAKFTDVIGITSDTVVGLRKIQLYKNLRDNGPQYMEKSFSEMNYSKREIDTFQKIRKVLFKK